MRAIRLAAVLLATAVAAACGSTREIKAAEVAHCSACHGFPPLASATGAPHPQSTACNLCHSETVDANGNIIPGGKHEDGQVEVTTHPLPYVAQHTAAALANIAVCTQCHGADYSGGASGTSCTSCHATFGFADWQTNCTFCHGTRTAGWDAAYLVTAAPPRGVNGETSTLDNAVGAHQKHLGVGSSISDGVACGECHVVPATLAHVDTSAPPPVAFGPLATNGGALAPQLVDTAGTLTCATTYCHGTTLLGGTQTVPTWTTPATAGCGTCHGLPPATGRHAISEHAGILCVNCHQDVASPTSVAIRSDPTARALHVNGAKDVHLSSGIWSSADRTCTNVACHGGPSIRSWGP